MNKGMHKIALFGATALAAIAGCKKEQPAVQERTSGIAAETREDLRGTTKPLGTRFSRKRSLDGAGSSAWSYEYFEEAEGKGSDSDFAEILFDSLSDDAIAELIANPDIQKILFEHISKETITKIIADGKVLESNPSLQQKEEFVKEQLDVFRQIIKSLPFDVLLKLKLCQIEQLKKMLQRQEGQEKQENPWKDIR
jgi:hypothetical protein